MLNTKIMNKKQPAPRNGSAGCFLIRLKQCLQAALKHSPPAHAFFGHGLDNVPMLHNLAVCVKAENVHHRFAPVLRRSAAQNVQHHQIAFRHYPFDFGAALRIFFQKRGKCVHKRLCAVRHGRIMLQVGFADIAVGGFLHFVSVERQFVKRQRVGFVAFGLSLRLDGSGGGRHSVCRGSLNGCCNQ